METGNLTENEFQRELRICTVAKISSWAMAVLFPGIMYALAIRSGTPPDASPAVWNGPAAHGRLCPRSRTTGRGTCGSSGGTSSAAREGSRKAPSSTSEPCERRPCAPSNEGISWERPFRPVSSTLPPVPGHPMEPRPSPPGPPGSTKSR